MMLNFISQDKSPIIVFFMILIHVTLLDLFYIGSNGVVFLWTENLHWLSLFVHLAIAFAAAFFYLGCECLTRRLVTNKLENEEKSN